MKKMLKSEIEFIDYIEIWWEDESPPFDNKLMGCIRKSSDGYYRFHPARKVVMNCKHARVLAEKLSDLNSAAKQRG